MEPNVIKMYQERFTEFLHVLKNDIYPESVPFQTRFSCTDHPVPWSERLDLEYKEIKKGEVWAKEWQSAWFNFSVEVPEEFADKHIPGAVNIPNETITAEEIPELPDKDQLILVYCRSGNRSKQASKKLAALGYTNVVEFGGINSWPGETVSG